jgi:hypothetical protein
MILDKDMFGAKVRLDLLAIATLLKIVFDQVEAT